MSQETAGLLVILDESAALGQEQASTLRGRRVTQQVSARVFVVEGSDPDELSAVPGLTVAAHGSIPEDLRKTLDASEVLFVDAWVERARPKARLRDGQSWDAPGFQPPDPPP